MLLDSLLQEDRVLAPQGPSSISAVAELVIFQTTSLALRSGGVLRGPWTLVAAK